MFDIFWKRPHVTKYPAYLGHTVYQSEYDALQEKLDQHMAASKESTQIITRQAREIEQITEQLDNREMIYNLAVAQIREMQEQLDALRQQQIMLSTTTPNKTKSKAKPKAVIE